MTTNAADIARLVHGARDGDREALDRLLAMHVRVAHTVALATVGHWQDAQDVVQSAFLSAVEHLRACREPARFTAWLMQIVRNTGINARKSRARTRHEDIHDASLRDPGLRTGVDETARAEARATLLAGLRELPERQRQVLMLHDLEGWKHAEIAEVLGISEVMSRQELFVARKSLRAAIEPTEQPKRGAAR